MGTQATLLRQWAMLRLVPRAPRKIDGARLEERLAERGFRIDRRTIQRDLMKLSEVFPLVCDERSKPYGWSWTREAEGTEIPAMEPVTALVFRMASSHLSGLLPAFVVRRLEPYVQRAGRVLDEGGADELASWPDKVRVVAEGLPRRAPRVEPEVLEGVGEGLLAERRLQMRYRKRDADEARSRRVDPLALVARQHVSYLVCTRADAEHPVQLALHRMTDVEVLDEEARIPPDFDVDAYIASGAFGVRLSDEPVRFAARVAEPVMRMVAEAPLGEDQELREEPEGDEQELREASESDGSASQRWWHLRVTLPMTQKLRAWVLSYGSMIRVVEPASLREDVAAEARALAAAYGRAE